MGNKNIFVTVSKIRKKAAKFYTNIYTTEFSEILKTEERENSLAILVQDRDVKRGYFATGDLKELAAIIKNWPEGTGVEVLSKVEISEVDCFLNQAGFEKYAVYIKAENNKIAETLPELDDAKFDYGSCNEYISDIHIEDVEAIHNFLYEAFNPLTSHIETKEELRDRILRGDIVIHKEADEIKTTLTFDRKQKSLYMEHMLNTGKSEYMHMLYYSVLKKAVDEGAVTVHTWIRETNDRAFNFVKRYGLLQGELKNFVFVKANK